MAYRGPKVKLSRRLGVPLTRKAVLVMLQKPYGPGEHGQRRSGRRTEFGRQLLEKQRLKFQYNVSEKQLKKYYDEAKKSKGNTGETLFQLLESRLDAQVLRAGFAPTIYAARQLVIHGHVQVNGKKITYPSYRIMPGTEISIKQKSRGMAVINEAINQTTVPPYLEQTKENYSAKFVKLPERSDIPVECEIARVVEFCSR